MKRNNQNMVGFTLVELMITLVVLAILVSAAAPSFIDLVRSNRVASQTNQFTAALALARSEAVKRNVPVFICKRNTAGTACDNSANWEAGWIVFAHNDGDSTLDSGEEIRVFEGLATGYTLRNGVSAYDNWIRYQPRGDAVGSGGTATYSNLSNTEVFRLCSDDAAAAKGRRINIIPSGRVNLVEGTSTCP